MFQTAIRTKECKAILRQQSPVLTLMFPYLSHLTLESLETGIRRSTTYLEKASLTWENGYKRDYKLAALWHRAGHFNYLLWAGDMKGYKALYNSQVIRKIMEQNFYPDTGDLPYWIHFNGSLRHKIKLLCDFAPWAMLFRCATFLFVDLKKSYKSIVCYTSYSTLFSV